MHRTIRLLGVLGLIAAGIGASCVPATPLGNTVQIPLDAYCTLEARVTSDVTGVAVAAHTFGVQEGAEPFSGCLWNMLAVVSVSTDQGNFSCVFRGPGAPSQSGAGVGCTSYPELGGLITWDQTWAPGTITGASVTTLHLDAPDVHVIVP